MFHFQRKDMFFMGIFLFFLLSISIFVCYY